MLPSLLLLLWVEAGCTNIMPSAPLPARTVVVVSWDTTRADALGCYQDVSHWGLNLAPDLRPVPRTPVADRLAVAGVRFQWAFSSAPTTLSSHTSLFAGLDPHQHRVVRNGFPVPEDVPLLAESLRSRGWQTAAVVGSSALEASMGLARGFATYDDPGPQPEGGMYLRDAADVTTRALALARAADAASDLFLFVHYYDPHTPWFTAPERLVSAIGVPGYQGAVDGSMASISRLTAQRHSGKMLVDDVRQARALYLAQVAWADEQTGLLLDGLAAAGRMEDALVVVLSDHGESLEEHGRFPYSHGPDVDLMNIHVPLIWKGTGRLALPVTQPVVGRQVRLMDVGTTLLALLEPEAPRLGVGEDLSPLWRGILPPAPPAFAEATKPIEKESTASWNNLPFERTVVSDGLMLVRSPWTGEPPQLYRMAPGQPTSQDPTAGGRLGTLLDGWDIGAPPHRAVELAPQTRAALETLGYLEPSPAPTPAPDPAHAPAHAPAHEDDAHLSGEH